LNGFDVSVLRNLYGEPDAVLGLGEEGLNIEVLELRLHREGSA
jgi:hypothetical protein